MAAQKDTPADLADVNKRASEAGSAALDKSNGPEREGKLADAKPPKSS